MNYAIRMIDIRKSFSGVEVLHGVNFEVLQGEVHALIGENGAGKSTLIKIISGALKKDSGIIELNGKDVEINSPIEANNYGIQCIYQELSLIPDLSVADNIFLCEEPTNKGIVDEKVIYKKAEEILKSLNLDIDVRSKVENIGIGHKYFVEISRCLSKNAKIVIMDEPTSAMTPTELESFFMIIEKLKKRGVSIIFISHRLEEIMQICDRVTVLRDGNYVATNHIKDISQKDIIYMMTGKELKEHISISSESIKQTNILLRVNNLSNSKLNNITFNLHEGEVLGITGLLGAGKSEIARAIFGADKIESGEILIEGKKIDVSHPFIAINNHIALIPEDRKAQGLMQEHGIRENISIVNLSLIEQFFGFFINFKKEVNFIKECIKKYNIKASSPFQKLKNLSGGNQQKVLLAKWIERKPKVLLLDEPTRGIDVGAKEEIYNRIRDISKDGVGVIIFSSEINEILTMCDRIIVLYDGTIRGELSSKEASQNSILLLSSGGMV